MSDIDITPVEIKEIDYSKIVKDKYMPKITQAQMILPENGVENITAALEALGEIAKAAKGVFEDGKINILSDSKYFLRAGAAVWRLVKVIPLCVPEIADLKEDEYKYLSSRIIETIFGTLRNEQ